ncbi:MAG: pyruvoyl-dependent arginine decarboxylase, partial [Bacillota bacterium]
MLPTPRKFTLVSGAAEGTTPLNAFDNALLASGIGNLNLL